jgi:uncharacterized protein DUF4062
VKKRYQIFISSTFNDMQEERTAIMQSIIKLGHFPAGMEIFGAVNDNSLNQIKRVIDESDYYLLITKGRYGTISERHKISYTEYEYNYAKRIKKPRIAIIHENYLTLPANTIDSEKKRARLDKFIKSVKDERQVEYWKNTPDLIVSINNSITKLISSYPASGWLSLKDTDGSDENFGITRTFKNPDEFYDYLEKILKKARVVRVIHCSNHTSSEKYASKFDKFLKQGGKLLRVFCDTNKWEVFNWVKKDLEKYEGYSVNFIRNAIINTRLMAFMILDDNEILFGTGRKSPQEFQAASVINKELVRYFIDYFNQLQSESDSVSKTDGVIDWKFLNTKIQLLKNRKMS